MAAVWRLHVGRRRTMSSIAGALLTPDHPVCVNGAWRTAGEVAAPAEVDVDSVYNFALTPPRSLLVRGDPFISQLPQAHHLSYRGSHAGPHATAHDECCTLGQPVPGIPEPVSTLSPEP